MSTSQRGRKQESSSWSSSMGVLSATMAALAVSGFVLAKTKNLARAEEKQSEPSTDEQKKQEDEVKPEEVAAETNTKTEPAEPEEDEEDEEELIGGIFRAVTAKNAAQLLGDKRSRRIVYLYKDSEGLGPVAQFAVQLERSMQVEPLLLDTKNEEDMAAVMAYFQEYNPKTVPQIEKEIPEKSFLLMNKYNDIWFWKQELMEAIYQHQIQVLAFFKGPDMLISEAQLVLYQSGDNDIHVVAYSPDLTNQTEQDKLKKFRQFHNNSEHMAGHYKFWLCDDANVAKTLGIDTTRPTGDVYVVREVNKHFNCAKPKANVFGFEYSCERLMTGDQVIESPDEVIKKLQELSFNAPMVCHDEMKFRKMLLGLPTLLIYCDPQVHGQETYDKIMTAVREAREKMPLIPSYSADKGGPEATPEVMFVVSTCNKLPPVGMLKKDKPQALFIKMGKDSQVDCIKEYLPAIEKIEGLSPAEFMEKAKNADKEFAPARGDDEAAKNSKQHMSIVFNEERFQMQAIHAETDPAALHSADSLLKFVNESLRGERPHHWLSENPKKEKRSVKVVGDSLKAHIYDTKRDALLLVYHPIDHKNRGLKERFEAYAKTVDSDKLLVARYNGVNESPVFKSPAKLPAIVHFSSVDVQSEEEDKQAASPSGDAPFGSNTSRVKEAIEYQFTRNHMVQSSTDADFKKAMESFIKEQNPNAKF